MTVIKQYNDDTDVWETIVVGEQGPPGLQGETGAAGAPGTPGAPGPVVAIKGTLFGTATAFPTFPATGDMWLVGDPIPTVIPDSSIGDPEIGDGVVWDGATWNNVGPVRGPEGPEGAPGGGGITSEEAIDAVATALTEGTGIDLAYDDGAGTITVTVDKTELSLVKADVGLGSVDNTADTAKPVSTAQQTALDLKVDKAQTINAQTSTTYSLVLTDDSKLVTLSNASAITMTVPLNSSVAFPVGTRVDIAQIGAGQVTVAAAGGVTVNATPGLKLRAQYAAATLVKTATDTWLLVGDLSA